MQTPCAENILEAPLANKKQQDLARPPHWSHLVEHGDEVVLLAHDAAHLRSRGRGKAHGTSPDPGQPCKT